MNYWIPLEKCFEKVKGHVREGTALLTGIRRMCFEMFAFGDGHSRKQTLSYEICLKEQVFKC